MSKVITNAKSHNKNVLILYNYERC